VTTTVRPAPLQTQDEELHGPVTERDAWYLINIALSFAGVVAVGFLVYSLFDQGPIKSFWLATFHNTFPYDISYLKTYFTFPQVYRAVQITFILAILAQTTGVILGLFSALGRQSRIAVVRVIAGLYIWIWRGTPVFLQLVLTAYGIPIILESMDAGDKGVLTRIALLIATNSFAAGYVALSLNEGAYMSEIVRAGIEAIDRGQMEAGKALGMTYGLAMRRIVLPQALKVIVPPTGNEFISMLKTTSLVSYIGLQELTLVTLQIYAHNFKVVESLVAAGVYYLAMTTILSLVQSQIEIRLGERRSEVRVGLRENFRRLFLGSPGVRRPRVKAAALPPKEHR
jgi:polar amino acid transport system permease protein